jgi:hypothetical protein
MPRSRGVLARHFIKGIYTPLVLFQGKDPAERAAGVAVETTSGERSHASHQPAPLLQRVAATIGRFNRVAYDTE